MALKEYCLAKTTGETVSPFIPVHVDGRDRLFFNKVRLDDYLYKVDWNFLDYSYAEEYFRTRGDVPGGACTVVRKGNLIGRNLDWYYNNQVEVVVQKAKSLGTYSSIGTCGGISTLTKSFIEDSANDKDSSYRVLPFQMQDGMNKYGLFAEYNVVTVEGENNTAIPTGTQEVSLSAITLVRYILDNFTTASSAVQYLQQHCLIYFPKALHQMHYELHLVVADLTNTYCVEFINNRTEVIDISSYPYMTNFYLHGVSRNSDGTVYTPATQTASQNAFDTNHITLNGSGLERYNYAVQHIGSVNNVADMQNLMKNLYYTRAYQSSSSPSDPIWYTEFVGNGRTVKSSPQDYAGAIETSSQMYLDRDRDTGLTWQTTHSVVYDLSTGKMYISSQEKPDYVELYNTNEKVKIKESCIALNGD